MKERNQGKRSGDYLEEGKEMEKKDFMEREKSEK